MIRRLTLVCTDDHSGWEIDEGDDDRCSQCGKRGQLRGVYAVVDLKTEKSDRD